ncbi:MAG: hypothetical protein QM703_18300 [Gemmatales bacterium]
MPATLELTRPSAKFTPTIQQGRKLSHEDFRDACLFGANSSLLHHGTFDEVEENLHEIWDDLLGPTILEWSEVKEVVGKAYSQGHLSRQKPQFQD